MAETRKFDEADILRPIDQNVRDAIAVGLKREFLLELNIPAEEWRSLEATFRSFNDLIIDWSGYLNKGEMAGINRISSSATKLSLTIGQVTQRGLRKILDYELAPMTSDQLLAALGALAEIAPRSPKTEDGKKPVGKRYQDDLKADLQLKLDLWWERNTGWSAETKEAEETPFSFFLEQIFDTLPFEVKNGLGHSRTAVNERRRRGKRRQTRGNEISEAFRKLHSSEAPTSD